jgi:S-DNA-T family DNA segregation ATPase FtsK/SpoIIIE
MSTRPAKRSTGTGKLELVDAEDGADTFGGANAEVNDETPNQKRSIDEMVADARVKRPDLSEEKEKPRPAGKVAKAVKTAISRIAVDFKLPSAEMLTPPAPRSEMEETELLERARQLAEKCREFNVSGQVKQISPGPVVTTFEFKPDPGVKYSRVTSLVDDLCLALKAESIRIDRIPGKSTVGIEVPNSNRETIRLREVIESKKFRESESKLTLALGKTIDGSNYAADLARMPHLLIAGATGAGKSVMLNAILVSLLYKASPDEVKMILVDPKRLELGLYADIPHLLTPIVTDPKRAGYALKWAVAEMESRYKHLAAFGVRNIDQYNSEVCAAIDRNLAEENPELPKPLPYIVVVIDELADLMMVAAREVEESITRLAQMARAVGIHLVLATQRPSVDVITGLIKANFPSRISFRVSSKVDSRTIIDTNGAEQLLGQGDMLFLPPGTSRLVRVHGAYVDEKEVKRICDYIRSQGNPAYDEKVVMSDKEVDGGEFGEMTKDEKYDDAVRIVVQSGKASTSLLQRHLRIGYGRAASIIDMMHREGIVGPEDGSKPRQVLIKADFVERLDQMREEQDR